MQIEQKINIFHKWISTTLGSVIQGYNCMMILRHWSFRLDFIDLAFGLSLQKLYRCMVEPNDGADFEG